MSAVSNQIGSLSYWRGEVAKWRKIHGKKGSRARQWNEPETAAMVLHLRSIGTSQNATSKATGVCRLEIGQILWRHRDAMAACRAALAAKAGSHATIGTGRG